MTRSGAKRATSPRLSDGKRSRRQSQLGTPVAAPYHSLERPMQRNSAFHTRWFAQGRTFQQPAGDICERTKVHSRTPWSIMYASFETASIRCTRPCHTQGVAHDTAVIDGINGGALGPSDAQNSIALWADPATRKGGWQSLAARLLNCGKKCRLAGRSRCAIRTSFTQQRPICQILACSISHPHQRPRKTLSTRA